MICPKCAARIPDDATSCVSCGAVIGSSSAPASATPGPTVAPVDIDTGKHAASQWLRLVNYFIDGVGIAVFSFLINIMLVPFGAKVTPEEFMDNPAPAIAYILFSFLYTAIYYTFFEAIWQRTPGKWASGTKVVMLDGSKPSVGRIIGRSFARYIPFEPLSYLFGRYPYGWHDALSKTTVVSVAYTPEDVASIDVHNKGKSSVWIWVLAIIGVLLPVLIAFGVFSAVVLTSLNSARAKGSDMAVKSNLLNVSYQAELYYDTYGSYEGFCESGAIASVKSAMDTSNAGFSCNDSKDEWAAAARLGNGTNWCSDSAGNSGYMAEGLADSTACSDEPTS